MKNEKDIHNNRSDDCNKPAGIIYFPQDEFKDEDKDLDFATAQRGSFEIVVSGTGELIPERIVDISGPRLGQYRNVRMAGVKITDIIPEGSKVKKGDYIATLDRTTFDNNLKDELAALDVLKRELESKILDTAVDTGHFKR